MRTSLCWPLLPYSMFLAITEILSVPIDFVCQISLWITSFALTVSLYCCLEYGAFIVSIKGHVLHSAQVFYYAKIQLHSKLHRGLYFVSHYWTDIGLAEADDSVRYCVVTFIEHLFLLTIDGLYGKGLHKGDRLPPERELALAAGVSRNLLREALVVLETKQVLSIREREGIQLLQEPGLTVQSPALEAMILWPGQSLGQLMEVREIAEIPAARLAAERRTDADLERMRRCIEELRQIEMQGEKIPDDGARWDALYHSAVVQAAGNEILFRIYESIHLLLVKYIGNNRARFYREALPDLAQRAWQEHLGLLRALEDRDADKAAGIMTDHLALARSWLEAQPH